MLKPRVNVKPDSVSLAIIGAGAAGLAAAIWAAEAASAGGAPCSVAVLEGARQVGAKILVSGGGRCNVTHDVVTPQDFFGNRRIIRNVLAAFPVQATIDWFASLGVALKREDTGKLFPVTDQARTVLTALLARLRDLRVDLRVGHRVETVSRSDGRFLVQHSQGTLEAERVILATGGRSLPRTGSDGSGYALARALGHHVSPSAPALVPLCLDRSLFHASLSGLSHDAELTTTVDGETVDRRRGSLLWTHFGISGPVVMDASRFWTLATEQGKTAALHANFVGLNREHLESWLLSEAAAHPRRSLLTSLAARIPERLAETLCRHAACAPRQALSQVRRADRARVVHALTAFRMPVERARGWNHAEVTAGGVPLEEIDYRTMASKLAPGLYLVGEILDCDGRIGGFNFQWAWATGYLAGRAAASR